MNLLLVFVVACNLGFTGRIASLCIFPTEWDGLWYDSRKKEVVLSHSTSAVLSGWTVQAYSSSVTSWTCVEQSADTYLLKGDQNVNVFSSLNWAYLCLKVTPITKVSFRYTILSDEQLNAGGERVSIIPTTKNASISGDCVATSPLGPEEYHALVKADNVSDVKQYFPEPLLAVLYNSAFVKTGPSCASDIILDMCSDRSTMNRTECSSVMGQVPVHEYHCVTHVQDGARYYVSLLNPQITGSDQQHFLCLAVTKLSSLVYISDNNGSCAKGQDPGVKQANGSEALVMYASVLCPFETSTAEESSDIGLIIGSVIASLVLLAVILSITVICLRKKCRDKMCPHCCKKYRKKGQHQEKRLQMSVDESLSSEDVEKRAEVSCAKTRELSSLSVILNNSNDIDTKNENAVVSGLENKVQGTDASVMSPQEFSDNPTKMEFGKAPVDARKDICYPTVMEPAETTDEARDPPSDVLEKNGKNLPQFLRQKTEDDMVELRRMNERVNLTKRSTSTSHDSEMTPSERIYFEKSVFAKQNVEAELYLSEEVFPDSGISSEKLADEEMLLSDGASADRDDLSTSLSVIIEDPERIPDLKLDCISSSERTHSTENKHKNDIASPVRKHSPEDRNLESTVIEEFEFSLTEEQITARSRLSTAMSSRVTSGLGSRRVSPAGAIFKGLRESIGGSKREPRRVEGPRCISRYTAYSVPISGSKARGHVKPSNPTISVSKRTASAISRPRNTTKKYKMSRINNGPKAPKMKFRWI